MLNPKFNKGDIVMISPHIDYNKKLYNRDYYSRKEYLRIEQKLYKIDYIYKDVTNLYHDSYFIYRLFDVSAGKVMEWYYESDLMFPFVND